MTDNNNTKLRAVLLAALMVLWVFAGTVAFAGGAAAQTGANVSDGGQPGNIGIGSSQAQDINGITVQPSSSTFSDSEAKVYVRLTNLRDVGAELDSAGLSNFQVSGASGASASAEKINSNSGETVATVSVSGISGASSFTLDFDLAGIDTTAVDDPTTGLDYEIAATEGSTTDSSFDGSNGNAPDGTSAGQATSGTFEISSSSGGANYEPAPTTDAPYVSGDIGFQGQRLKFIATDNPNNNQYRLRNYDPTATNQIGGVVRSPTFNRTASGEWTAAIRTEGLEGSYILTKNGGDTSNAVTTNNNGKEDGTGTQEPVDILVQNIDVNFSDEDQTFRVNESYDIDFDSPARNGYAVNVTEDSLDGNELADIFPSATEIDDDVAQIRDIESEDTREVFFDDDVVDAGDYEFEFEVNDTGSADTVAVTLEDEVDADVEFEQGQINQNRGDWAEINMTAEGDLDDEDAEFDVIIGDLEDDGYQANVTVSPNETGHVSLGFNTYNAGQGRSPVVVAQEGSVERFDEDTADGGNLGAILSDDLYDVVAQEKSNSITNLDTSAEEYQIAVLNIVPRSTNNLTVYRAPQGEQSELDEASVITAGIEAGNVTETEEIAIAEEGRSSDRRGDLIVAQLDVNGIFGSLPQNPSVGDLNTGEIQLNINQTNEDPNRQKLMLDTSATPNNALELVRDDDNNTAYIVADSDQLVFKRGPSGTTAVNPQVDDRFEFELNVTETYLERFVIDNNDAADNETVSDNFEYVDREVEYDTVDEKVQVQAADNETITGTTTIAPGTEINVRARATSEEGENAFIKSVDTNVSANGEFAAEFAGEDSFEDVTPPQNFTVTVIQQSFEDDAEEDGRVVEGDYAEVEITNQTTDGTTATVDRVYLPDGGFVTIHDGTLLDGATFDSVRGTSDYLESGESTDVEVSLDTPYEGDNGTVIAMPHQDTNDNETYDFVTSEGEDDSPYTNAEGEIVLDSASLTVDTSTPTPTATATATPEPTATATDEPTATETASEDQPGFGAVIALIALLGAALLAARRNAF
jgi:surface glycoprotein (TIGR04207 family)/PGF-CTERM protein